MTLISSIPTSSLQHDNTQPILDWFGQKQITVQADHHSVDTTGFFDEIATSIGKNLSVLNEVLERIRWAQQKDYSSTTIHLDKKSADDARAITSFCQQLYDFSLQFTFTTVKRTSFVWSYRRLLPSVASSMATGWTVMPLDDRPTAGQTGSRSFSCARNLNIQLRNQESYELDVFMLIDGKRPVCIECKSGERSRRRTSTSISY